MHLKCAPIALERHPPVESTSPPYTELLKVEHDGDGDKKKLSDESSRKTSVTNHTRLKLKIVFQNIRILVLRPLHISREPYFAPLLCEFYINWHFIFAFTVPLRSAISLNKLAFVDLFSSWINIMAHIQAGLVKCVTVQSDSLICRHRTVRMFPAWKHYTPILSRISLIAYIKLTWNTLDLWVLAIYIGSFRVVRFGQI